MVVNSVKFDVDDNDDDAHRISALIKVEKIHL